MALTKEQMLANVHEQALAEFEEIQAAVRDERKQCLEDRRFYSIAGAQWEGQLGDQFENKPKFEVNKIALAIQRIFTEYRNNRISVKFNNKPGNKRDMTDICAGMYRADEQDSCAEEAYDNAFEEGTGGGFGAWRLRACYEDEEDDEKEYQRIKIEPIFDADSSVFFDLNAKRQDKSDARHCFVITAMSRQAYKDEWGDDPATWPKQIEARHFDWATPDVVYVAEYYRIEEVKDSVHTFTAIDGSETKYRKAELTEEFLAELAAVGSVETKVRKTKTKKVHLYIMSGGKVLSDEGYIPGKCIPIVPYYGKRWYVDNIERCSGHVRNAKDAQRLKNMQVSKLGEISASSTIEKPIFTPEQIAGHQSMWSNDNVKNYPYMLINPITSPDGQPAPAGPVGYTKSPEIPPAMAALLQLTEQDIRDILGNQEQGDKIISNISGEVVKAVQQRLDMQSYLYMSNMAKAIRRSGEIWLSMAKDIYVEEDRPVKLINAQNETEIVNLVQPTMGEDESIEYENDLSAADMEVSVDVGPSFTSQRAAIVKAVTDMMAITTNPEDQRVLQAIALMNMEGEGLSDAREYFRRRLVDMGVTKPNEEDTKRIMAAEANKQPDPNVIFLQAAADEATAKATNARADVIKTMADVELTKAKALETLANIDLSNRDQLIKFVEMLVPDRKLEQNRAPNIGTSDQSMSGAAGLPQDMQNEFMERLSNA